MSPIIENWLKRLIPELVLASIMITLVSCHLLSVIAAAGPDAPSRDDHWRRTTSGWEYANSLSIPNRTIQPHESEAPYAVSPVRSAISPTGQGSGFHWFVSLQRCLVPVSLACFLGTFGSWLLLALPNQAIVRQSDEKNVPEHLPIVRKLTIRMRVMSL